MKSEKCVATTRQILEALTESFPGIVGARLWDGSTWQSHENGVPGFTLILHHPGAARAMFWPFSNLALGESYVFDDFDIEGDTLAFADWMGHLMNAPKTLALSVQVGFLLKILTLPRQFKPRDRAQAGRPTAGKGSQATDQESIEYTYDRPSELYCEFLDPNLQYTCGYFAESDEDLDAAQERKIDYVCRKLRLQPGEQYVDFGCGWGALLIHAARNYGVDAVGVTLSEEQAKWAEKSIAEAGLQDKVRIELCDYRNFNAPGEFDKASSVGMSEHIGNRNLPTFHNKIHECLRPGGVYLHHAITIRPNDPLPVWKDFCWKYVFPNGELQTVVKTLDCAAKAGFEVRDVESLREHYILTLQHWIRRLVANHDRILKWTDEEGYRIFRLYLSGAVSAFKSGVCNLHQCLLVKPIHDRPEEYQAGLPLTRASWYE